jgi:enoyl-CoA hydratase/carnithine racemase
MAELRYAVANGVARITLANEAKRNALTLGMWESLGDLMARAASDAEVRAVVVTGAGTAAFCSGNDVGEYESERATPEQVAHYNGLQSRANVALEKIGKPTIAMISGYCLGAGLVLALRCDLRYCTADASFSVPVARFGLPFRQSGLQRVVDLVGPMHAKEMLYTARRYDAAWAEKRGLVNAIAADHAALETMVAGLAAQLAANAPLTIGQVKFGIAQATRRDAPPDEATCKAIEDSCYASADYKEGRRAFMEKRVPKFRGV